MLLASKTHSNSHAREETGGTIEAISEAIGEEAISEATSGATKVTT